MTLYKWDITAANNATADSTINWAEGQAPSSVNDSARAMMAAITKGRYDCSGGIFSSGTSTAYSFASWQVFDTLAHMNGAVIGFIAHVTSGASPTLNVDSLGAKPIRGVLGVGLSAGALVSGSVYICTYYFATGEFVLHNQPSVLPANIVTTSNITDANVTLAKIVNTSASRLLGNPTGGAATPSEISLDASLAFSGTAVGVSTGGVATGNLANGAVTTIKIANSAVTSGLIGAAAVITTSIADANVTTAKIADANVTLAKIVNTTAARLLGNPTGGAAAPSEISLDSTLAFSGTTVKVSPSTGLTAALAVDYASKSDQQTGSSTAKSVNPAHQQDHKSAIKAHGQFEGRPTASLLGGYGFTSIARTSAGLYVLTFTTAFANTTYTVHVNGAGGDACSCYVGTKTTTTVQINTVNLGSSPVGSDNKFDVMCAGDQ